MNDFLQPGDLVLFQGDSITDGSRAKHGDFGTTGEHLGAGYAMLVAATLALDAPDRNYEFRNLGISGNRVVDLYARIKEHGWKLAPDVLSIMIGINDTWHEYKRGSGVGLERYERVYRQLLADTRERLPAIRFVLCEPFCLPCGEVVAGWREDVDARIAVVRRLAGEFEARMVPCQEAFDAALDLHPAAFWAADGVHPGPAGHLLLARTWLRAVCGGG